MEVFEEKDTFENPEDTQSVNLEDLSNGADQTDMDFEEPDGSHAHDSKINNVWAHQAILVEGDGDTYIANERLHGLPKPLSLEQGEIQFAVEHLGSRYADCIEKECFTIVNSFHYGINQSIVCTLASLFRANGHDVREGFFDKYVTKNKTSDISQYIDDFKANLSKEENGKKHLVIIRDSFSSKTPELLKAIAQLTQKGENDLLQKLGANIRMVYLTHIQNPRFLEKSIFNVHTVDSFNVYVQSHDAISEDLAQLIRSQQQQGKWGKEDIDLLNDLDKIIDDPDFVTRIRKKSEEESFGFLEVLRNKDQIMGRYVLLVACLFPRLSPETFSKYLSYLISGKTTPQKKKRKIPLLDIWEDESDDILHQCHLEYFHFDNQYVIDFKSTPDALRCEKELFGKFTGFVDKSARLLYEKANPFTENVPKREREALFEMIAKMAVSFKSHYGEALLDSLVHDLETLRREIHTSHLSIQDLRSDRKYVSYLLQRLKKIQFEEDFIAHLRQISPKRLKYRYENRAMEQRVSKFLFYREEGIPDTISAAQVTQDLQQWQTNISEALQEKYRQKRALQKTLGRNGFLLTKLLSLFHEKDALVATVHSFLSKKARTIEKNLILLDLVSWLHHEGLPIEAHGYFKRALEHPNNRVSTYAFDVFSSLLGNMDQGYYPNISPLKNWLPEMDKPFDKTTSLEQYSLAIVFWSLNIKFLKDVKNPTDTGELLILVEMDTISSTMYQSLLANPQNMEEHLKWMLPTLFQENMAKAVQKVLFKNTDGLVIDEIIKEVTERLCMFILLWFRLLGEKKSPPNTNDQSERFIKALKEGIPGHEVKKIRTRLKELRMAYNQKLAYGIQDAAQKEKIKRTRTFLIELLTQLTQ